LQYSYIKKSLSCFKAGDSLCEVSGRVWDYILFVRQYHILGALLRYLVPGMAAIFSNWQNFQWTHLRMSYVILH